MLVLKCTSCGGRIEVGGNADACVCKYCGSTVRLSENGVRDEDEASCDSADGKVLDKAVKRLVLVLACCFILTVGLSLLGFVLSIMVVFARLFFYSLF